SPRGATLPATRGTRAPCSATCARTVPDHPRPPTESPMRTRPLPALMAVALLAACASGGDRAHGDASTLTPLDAPGGEATGRIVQVEPRPDRTCFEMTATRLDHQGRPYWAEDDLGGRFIACRAGYYDPAVFRINRDVTFAGRVAGYENRRIDGQSFRFPRVEADEVRLWPERRQSLVTRPPPWPWWGYW